MSKKITHGWYFHRRNPNYPRFLDPMHEFETSNSTNLVRTQAKRDNNLLQAHKILKIILGIHEPCQANLEAERHNKHPCTAFKSGKLDDNGEINNHDAGPSIEDLSCNSASRLTNLEFLRRP